MARRRLLSVVLFAVLGAGVAVSAGEPPPPPGRAATVFFVDGTRFEGRLLGYADGVFHVAGAGQEGLDFEAADVERVYFGDYRQALASDRRREQAERPGPQSVEELVAWLAEPHAAKEVVREVLRAGPTLDANSGARERLHGQLTVLVADPATPQRRNVLLFAGFLALAEGDREAANDLFQTLREGLSEDEQRELDENRADFQQRLRKLRDRLRPRPRGRRGDFRRER